MLENNNSMLTKYMATADNYQRDLIDNCLRARADINNIISLNTSLKEKLQNDMICASIDNHITRHPTGIYIVLFLHYMKCNYKTMLPYTREKIDPIYDITYNHIYKNLDLLYHGGIVARGTFREMYDNIIMDTTPYIAVAHGRSGVPTETNGRCAVLLPPVPGLSSVILCFVFDADNPIQDYYEHFDDPDLTPVQIYNIPLLLSFVG